jgi:hypothetical protein
MRYRARMVRLEAYRRTRLPPSHFLSVVTYPWHLTYSDQERWLRELTCACGVVGCPLMQIGALLPQKAPSIKDWAEPAQTSYAQRRGHHA